VAGGLLARPGGAPVRSTPVEDYPRVQAAPAGPDNGGSGASKPVGGIKASTVGTTLYLLPSEHKRIKRLALDMDVASVHELLLLGLDRLLMENGGAPVARYSPPRSPKS
jgi:hypothetical protein